MVTMQGEDSGIAWETTPSRSSTPWVPEAGNPTVDLSSCVSVQPATAGSHPAGKIIFVMDEDLISRRKKTQERVSNQRSRADRQREVLSESSENISGRPELVEVSQPNVKIEGEGDEDEGVDHLVDKEQRLFSLVSDGFEILNIIVPPKLATVDEEESREMVDNLSYLEEIPVPKAGIEAADNELLISTSAPTGAPPLMSPRVMDPPGAPVARTPGRGAAGSVDYFEAFTLIDAQAPGGPAVVALGHVEPEAEGISESQHTGNPVQPQDATTSADNKSDTISLGELTSELLDDVFYCGTDNYESPDRGNGGEEVEEVRSKLPSKPSGSNLFGSQEDILTPIFLPEGPPKIIDQILLEEPKAMAFLYTDLYEEAAGSRKKEEDTESLTSEKSFHSRHSDREARGYLEKYVLIDETPALEGEHGDNRTCEEGPRVLAQDLYEFGEFMSKSEVEVPTSEEEITDFFRCGDNSSPCDVDPFPGRTLEEDETKLHETITTKKAKANKSVSISVEKVTQNPVDPLSISSFEFPAEEPDWGITDDYPASLDEEDASVNTTQEIRKQDLEMEKPVAPPRRKVSPPKMCLDLTPLTPVDVFMQEKEEEGEKEKREDEVKETASPAETADEGEGDGEETIQSSFDMSLSENELPALETGPAQGERDVDEINDKDIKPAAEQKDTEDAANIKSSESAATEMNPENQVDSSASATEAAKAKGQCVIL